MQVSVNHRISAATLVAAAVAMALDPTAAVAQGADDASMSLEEVVVTARK